MRKKVNLKEKFERYKEKKIKLIRENPNNSIVYEFKSPIIKERFSKVSRQTIFIKNATIDLWGYLLDNNDKKNIEEKFNEVLELAKKIIQISEEFGEFDYTALMTKSVEEKIRTISNKNSMLIEVFVSSSDEEDILFKTLFKIDTFDTKAKRDPQKSEEWVTLLNEYEKSLNDLKLTAFKIFKAKIRAKHLIPYGGLRFEFKKWIVTQNENAQG